MCEDWKTAKNHLIQEYFSNDEYMQSVAEEAYMGNWSKQEELAEWFDKQDLHSIAETWRRKASLIRDQLGFEI